ASCPSVERAPRADAPSVAKKERIDTLWALIYNRVMNLAPPLRSRLQQGLLEASPPAGRPRTLGRLGRWLVTAFVVYHMTSVLLVHLPEAGMGRAWLRDISGWMHARRYVQTTAHWQNWGLFAP